MLNVYGFEGRFWALKTAALREIKMAYKIDWKKWEEDAFEALGEKSWKEIEQRRIDHIIDYLDVLG